MFYVDRFNLAPYMKKNDYQSTPVEEKATSTTLALKQLNKEAEKKETAAESAKVRCRTCFKEIAPTPRCFGHGGGGGVDESSSSEEDAGPDDEKSLEVEQLANDTKKSRDELLGSIEGNEVYDSESQSDEKTFDPKIIAELIAKNLLVIDNDRESMTLTINLQCNPNSLSKDERNELKKFMEAIITQFDKFKEQHNLPDDCMVIQNNEEGNILSLRISLKPLALYDEFIQHLANNLLPTPAPKLQAKNEPQQMEDEKREIFNPSPFSTQMKPW